MANTSRIRGLVPVGTLSGSPWASHVRMYAVAAANPTAIFRGDAVKLVPSDTAGTWGAETMPAVRAAAAGDALLGVCVGPLVNRAISQTEAPGYLPASTAGFILVAIGTDVLYEVQDDASATIGTTHFGNVGNLVAGAGSATTGVSAYTLNATDTNANTSGHQMLLVSAGAKIDNDPTAVSAKWIVRINNSQIKLGQ